MGRVQLRIIDRPAPCRQLQKPVGNQALRQVSGSEQKDIQKAARRHRTHAGGRRPQIGPHHAGLVGHVLPVADKDDARADADQIGQGEEVYPAVSITLKKGMRSINPTFQQGC